MQVISVFAYGSNLCSGRLSAYHVKPLRAYVAKLPFYTLRFHKVSDDGSGKADIVKSDYGEVWGVVYEMAKADFEKLMVGEKGYEP